MKRIRSSITVLCGMALGATSVLATDRHVPSEYATIQAAVYACVNGDTVTVADGTYTGPGNKNIICDNRAITIRSANGPANCVIDCEEDGSGISFVNMDYATLSGLTVQRASGPAVSCGCQYAEVHLTVTNCIFVNNSRGIHVDTYGMVRAKNCRFLGNHGDEGAGIYCASGVGVSLCNCRFIGNSANFMGGAIYGGHCTLVNCLLVGNTAQFYGGAVFLEGSGLDMRNTTIAGNTAGWYGGGLYLYDGAWGSIFNSVAALNSAPYGSQMALEDSSSVQVWFSDFAGAQPIYVSGASYVDWESGNINADPLFVDAANGDYHLLSGSPCADAGNNTLIDYDYFDLDGDGITSEPLPYDLDNGWRVEDDPNAADTGYGGPPIVDMGAYEWTSCPVGDVNCDGLVDFGDINAFVLALTNLSAYIQMYHGCPPRHRDINGDGYFDFGDINPFVALLTGR